MCRIVRSRVRSERLKETRLRFGSVELEGRYSCRRGACAECRSEAACVPVLENSRSPVSRRGALYTTSTAPKPERPPPTRAYHIAYCNLYTVRYTHDTVLSIRCAHDEAAHTYCTSVTIRHTSVHCCSALTSHIFYTKNTRIFSCSLGTCTRGTRRRFMNIERKKDRLSAVSRSHARTLRPTSRARPPNSAAASRRCRGRRQHFWSPGHAAIPRYSHSLHADLSALRALLVPLCNAPGQSCHHPAGRRFHSNLGSLGHVGSACGGAARGVCPDARLRLLQWLRRPLDRIVCCCV